MRTLVISDLHLGNRARRDVLRRSGPRDRLLDVVEEVDRLVLLGDLVELMSRSARRSLAVAEPVLRAIGQRLGAGREAIIVPGNHDGPLVRGWVRGHARTLSLTASVPPDATPALARVASWLAPARVSVHYPGVWLAERIWATHGHYLDRYLFPESAFGALRSARDRRSPARQRPIDYERARRSSAAGREPPAIRLPQRPLGRLLENAAELVRTSTRPVPRMMMNAHLAGVTAAVADLQMQHASIPAMARVVERLGVPADLIVFGHVHRTGPLAGDQADLWSPAGAPRMFNTGSWLYEPLLLDRASPPHPYWPGGAVLLEPGASPRAFSLLDGLAARDLRAPV